MTNIPKRNESERDRERERERGTARRGKKERKWTDEQRVSTVVTC
jgi:hypothetical protein